MVRSRVSGVSNHEGQVSAASSFETRFALLRMRRKDLAGWMPTPSPSTGRVEKLYSVAVPFIVGSPLLLAVHSSMPAAVLLALTLNSEPSNSGCRPR